MHRQRSQSQDSVTTEHVPDSKFWVYHLTGRTANQVSKKLSNLSEIGDKSYEIWPKMGVQNFNFLLLVKILGAHLRTLKL